MIDLSDVPMLARQAHAKLPNYEMTESEFYAWMDTLPENEGIAVFIELLEIESQSKEPTDG